MFTYLCFKSFPAKMTNVWILYFTYICSYFSIQFKIHTHPPNSTPYGLHGVQLWDSNKSPQHHCSYIKSNLLHRDYGISKVTEITKLRNKFTSHTISYSILGHPRFLYHRKYIVRKTERQHLRELTLLN